MNIIKLFSFNTRQRKFNVTPSSNVASYSTSYPPLSVSFRPGGIMTELYPDFHAPRAPSVDSDIELHSPDNIHNLQFGDVPSTSSNALQTVDQSQTSADDAVNAVDSEVSISDAVEDTAVVSGESLESATLASSVISSETLALSSVTSGVSKLIEATTIPDNVVRNTTQDMLVQQSFKQSSAISSGISAGATVGSVMGPPGVLVGAVVGGLLSDPGPPVIGTDTGPQVLSSHNSIY